MSEKPRFWVPAHVLAEVGDFATYVQIKARTSTAWQKARFTRELPNVVIETGIERLPDPAQGEFDFGDAIHRG